MNVSDPIADMLTRLRNASRARHDEVVLPSSRTKLAIANILVEEMADDVVAQQTSEINRMRDLL